MHAAPPAGPPPPEWKHGALSRGEVDALMTQHGRSEGLYLVRESTRTPGGFVLSCIAAGTLQHYIIGKYGGQFGIDDGPKFNTLEDLIGYYQTTIDRLPTRLIKACPAQAVVARAPEQYEVRRARRAGLPGPSDPLGLQHPAPCTPLPCTLHPAPRSPAPRTLHPAPRTLHPAPRTLRPAPRW